MKNGSKSKSVYEVLPVSHRIAMDKLKEQDAADDGANNNEKTSNEIKISTLKYRILDTPPVPVTIMAALQHILLSISGCLTTSSVVSDAACVPYDHPVRSQLFCTTMFMVGFCTLTQTWLGVRLPIFQGPSSSFLVPLLALQRDPVWQCKKKQPGAQQQVSTDSWLSNVTVGANMSSIGDVYDPLPGITWRLQEMAGALMVASLVEVIFGGFGLLGLMLRFIGPITVACTISLIGVSLFRLPSIYSKPNFIVALSCMVVVMVFILYLPKFKVPLPRMGKGSKSKPRSRFAVFQLIPILLGVIIMWAVVWILTLCNVFTDDQKADGYMARADAKLHIIYSSDWFHFTYPGQFGAPKLNVALTIGFLVSCMSSVVESVGDYYAAQQACELSKVPDHAISRGILVEGIGSVLSGAVGAGHATTSYSGNIAVLKLSKTVSRVVMYVAGGLLIFVSLFGKVGAALTTIPNPILGGVLMIIVGTLVSIGLSSLKDVDMTSSRNLLVVGVPFMAGIVVPAGLEMYPNLINTGLEEADRTINVILGTPMFLGGFLAMFLDNTVPGSLESRGMASWKSQGDEVKPTFSTETEDVYSWSLYNKLIKFLPFLTRLPFMPNRGNPGLININNDEDLESQT